MSSESRSESNSWVRPHVAINGDIIFEFSTDGSVSATFEYDNKKKLKTRSTGAIGIHHYTGQVMARFHREGEDLDDRMYPLSAFHSTFYLTPFMYRTFFSG